MALAPSELPAEAGPNRNMRLDLYGPDKFEHFELLLSQNLQGLLPIVAPRTPLRYQS